MANSLNENIENRYVILKSKFFKGDDIDRVFLCKDGFGCSPDTMGYAVFGDHVSYGIDARVEGNEILRFAIETEVEEAKKRLQEKKQKEIDNTIGIGI